MFELPVLYQQALKVLGRLHKAVKSQMLDYASVDDPLILARSDLRYWCSEYRMGQATALSGFLLIEKALDALDGAERAA